MYWYEGKIKAIQLSIQFNPEAAVTVREPEYPSTAAVFQITERGAQELSANPESISPCVRIDVA